MAMVEVYSGSRPGRPVLLLISCALALSGAIGVASLQVHDTRRLGDEVRIPGTPLVVRPPRDWRPDPKDPSAFVRTVEVEGWGRSGSVIERRIRFRYQRWQVFRPTPELLERRNFMDAYTRLAGVRATRVGPLDAVQVVRSREFQLFDRTEVGSMVYRLAMSPRGEEINVEYIPLSEMAPGDVDLLDEICAHVRIDDPLLERTADQHFAHAGLRFEPDPGWRIFPPDLAETPGLYVQGNDGGIPVWAIGVFRTWIAPDRTPEQLLTNFAEALWLAQPGDVRIETRTVPGGTLYQLAPRASLSERPAIDGPRLIVRDPSHAALVFVIAAERYDRVAAQAADRITASLQISGPPLPVDLAAAQAAGVALAGRLASGPAAHWQEPEEFCFYSETIQPPFWRHAPRLILDLREPLGRSGDWRGVRRYERVTPDLQARETERKEEWFLAAEGGGFRTVIEDPEGGRVVTTTEERLPGAAELTRTVRDGSGPPRSDRLPIGPAFVAGPIEGVAEAQAASGAAPELLLELSDGVSSTTFRRLFKPLAPDADGRARVLLLDDFFPRGMIVVLDESGAMLRQEDPGRRLERIRFEDVRARLTDWAQRQ